MSHARRFSRNVAATLLLALLAFSLFGYSSALADSLSVTVTPPLVQLTIGPGETWRSALKIVNTNASDITYYSQLMDMEASDESGHGKFTPVIRSASSTESGTTLASWIEVPSEPVVVKAGASGQLPFTVRIPEDASPGGHYAAILVGTQPGKVEGGSGIAVSSYVSSLIFVKIKGDIVESGRVREFVTSKQLYQEPHAEFTLRFENTGNTHLRPAGSIEIYNMWGRERGRVEIAQDSTFGNVLPNSVRKFNFSWDGEESLFDIGRYSAQVTLAYGDEGKQSASAVTYFWVVPVVPVAITLGSLITLIILVAWLIRRYIRRALALERVRYGQAPEQGAPRISQVQDLPRSTPSTMHALMEPIREGVIDLRSVTHKSSFSAPVQLSSAQSQSLQRLTLQQFIGKYKLFLLFILVLVLGGFGVWRYFSSTLKAKSQFQITDVKIEVEDIATQQ